MVPTIHNHKARRDYFITETYEAGIELKGTEVKSLRNARASIDEAFARVERGQCWLYNAHINPYEFGNRYNVDPLRPRRLLLHKKEIDRLAGQLNTKGMALVPLKIYFTKSFAKVLLGLGKGKSADRQTRNPETQDRRPRNPAGDAQCAKRKGLTGPHEPLAAEEITLRQNSRRTTFSPFTSSVTRSDSIFSTVAPLM